MEIKVPTLGESITEATIARWYKKKGDWVEMDEALVELETDKITVEVNAPNNGILEKIESDEGAIVNVGSVIGYIKVQDKPATEPQIIKKMKEETPPTQPASPHEPKSIDAASFLPKEPIPSPAAQKQAADRGIDLGTISGTGKDGRITKEDVIFTGVAPSPISSPSAQLVASRPQDPKDREKRVPMSRLRQKIAERLKLSQNTAAMLTTFNEVDMSAVMHLRQAYKEPFEKEYGVKLGFMSFFTKASIAALKKLPALNAEIRGADIIYKNFYNIGIAVGTDAGLVVPVVKEADQFNFAQVEQEIALLGKKARNGQLSINDLSGGTFTISNGGVYGSLLSTPILNPPQSSILGLHKIEKRPVVINDTIEIRPMMYLALTYDHRLIDGKEAVTFLVYVKEYIESPNRLLLDL